MGRGTRWPLRSHLSEAYRHSETRTGSEVRSGSRWLSPLTRRRQAPSAISATTHSSDGTALSCVMVEAGADRPALVYAHGFLGGKDHRAVPRFLAALSRDWSVYAFDFRGHGQSGGACRFADGEVADMDAVVRLARSNGHSIVVTVGSSMGGATAIRHAAACDSVAAVVTIGVYASANPLLRSTTQGLLRLAFHRGSGGNLVQWALGARLGSFSLAEGQPVEAIRHISPRPVLLVHGGLDPLIPPSEAYRLQAAGGSNCDLLMRPWHGHDQPHLNADTARRITAWARARGVV